MQCELEGTMKKTDIGVVGFMYAVCAFFFLMSRDLKKGARIYPLCIIAILFLLTTGYVVEMLFAAKKNGVTSGIPEIFEGFQPKQFFIVLGMLIAYLIGMYFVGFYLDHRADGGQPAVSQGPQVADPDLYHCDHRIGLWRVYHVPGCKAACGPAVQIKGGMSYA